ncbi:MAG: hypothetical protein ABI142_04785 [Bryocella sp.]
MLSTGVGGAASGVGVVAAEGDVTTFAAGDAGTATTGGVGAGRVCALPSTAGVITPAYRAAAIFKL